MYRSIRLGMSVGPVLGLVVWTAACAPVRQPAEAPVPSQQAATAPATASDTQQVSRIVQSDTTATRSIPYEGAFGPSMPPSRAPASQKPLDGWVKEALAVWYERPSPKGPPPIPLATPKALYVVGKGPVIQILPGPAAFPDKIPERIRTALPPKIPFSNNVKRLSRGDIRVVAVDRTLNDTKVSRDSMAIAVSFTDADGADWRIELASLAPISPNPVTEPWFGGLAIDTLYHGQTGNGTPAEPLVRCELCSWGWADVYKNGKRVASSAPLHIMVTSRVRDDRNGFKYACYDCTKKPIEEVHVIVHPSAYLPSPGGFLHIMWENADVHTGTPDQIARIAPKLAEDVPTIELSAVPYLKWDKPEIHVKTGQKYRLVVHNNDPSSFHQFRLHDVPESAEHHEDPGDIRHEEGMTAGGIGPLWKPGAAEKEDMNSPGPKHVFFSLPQGSTWATYIQFDKPGEYAFMCPVGNHFRRGMSGKFIVSSAVATNAKSATAAVAATTATGEKRQ